MRIQQSQTALASERLFYSRSRTEQTLDARIGSGDAERRISLAQRVETEHLEFETYRQLGRSAAIGRPARAAPAAASLLPRFQPLQLAPPRSAPSAAPQATPDATAPLSEEDGEILLLKLLIELLTGHEISVARVQAGAAATAEVPTAPAAGEAQYSIDYSFSQYSYEAEQTSFRATGSVTTDDGREIAFDLQVEMARSFESFTQVEFHAGRRKDPLALNLGGAGPELSDATVAFDLDADGSTEQVHFATGATAFLALDADGDGRIGNGRELFGALSGDGFADLARHDEDGNGFIDEGDAVFAQLLAWSKDEDGNDSLRSLASLGVGALWLGSASTPFELRGPGNEAQGAVRRSGVYLNENGTAGALQQLDLVV